MLTKQLEDELSILKEKLESTEQLLSENPYKQLVDQLQMENQEMEKQKNLAMEEVSSLREQVQKLELRGDQGGSESSRTDYNVSFLLF